MQPDGTFLAYGEPSAESCAQVLLALAALGIDPEQEFGSVNPETGLAEFRKADGSYAHLLTDTEGNLMATEQAMLALCALERLRTAAAYTNRNIGRRHDGTETI